MAREVLEKGTILLRDNYGSANIKYIRSKTLMRFEHGGKWVEIKMRNGKPSLYTNHVPGKTLWIKGKKK